MSESTIRVQPGEAIGPHLRPGATVVLSPGVHVGSLTIECSVTLCGEPGAILDAERAGPVLRIDQDGLNVVVAGLTLRGGAGEAGAGVLLTGWSEVTLNDVVLEDNQATLSEGGVGGGAYLFRGLLTAEDCTFRNNRAGLGNDLAVSGAARCVVRGGFFAGDVVCREGAELTITGAHVSGQLQLRGTTTRAPQVALRGARIDGGVQNDLNLPATVSVEDG
jgi:nitrous oxidase accessory protein NosD